MNSFNVVASGGGPPRFRWPGVSSASGRMPGKLVMDVSAAPGASSTRPVASVFWNGILLAAKQLEADGRYERLTARVPGYVSRVTNAVRCVANASVISVDCWPRFHPRVLGRRAADQLRETGKAEPDSTRRPAPACRLPRR